MAEDRKQLRWQDLDGQERYRVVELIRKGEVKIQDLCRTFGVSRQTLHRAVAAADQAAMEALTRKPRGRRPEPASKSQVRELTRRNRQLTEDFEHMSKRYEVAKALLELQRKVERGETLPGEKKPPKSKIGPDPQGPGRAGQTSGMAGRDDGRGTGDDDACSREVGPPSGDRRRG